MDEYKWRETEPLALLRRYHPEYSEALIAKYRETHCLGCGNVRKYCQCPFSGTAHPSQEERRAWVRRQLDALKAKEG